MFAAGDLDLTFNGTGFNITSPISPRNQFSTTMGIIPDGSNAIVMGGYRDVAASANRIKDPADLELVFLNSTGQLNTNIGTLGSVTAQVGLGDSRIAGIAFQQGNIITAGYTVVSGNDLVFTIDNSNPQAPNRVTSASRLFSPEDVGATLTIVADGDVNSRWLVNDYTIVSVNAAGAAFLNVAPAEAGIVTGAVGGWWTLNGSTDMLVSRFTYAAGAVALDTSFGIGGHAIIPVASGVNNYDYAYAVEVDSLNRIVVVGYSQNTNGEYDMSVARLQPNGALDTTFFWANQPGGTQANRGRVKINIKSDDYANAVSITPSNQIFISGSSNGRTSPAPTVVKLDTFGVPMASFGPNGNGIVSLTSSQTGRGFINSSELYPAGAGALAGYLVATGTNTGSNRNTFVTRINGATGALDTTFGTGGAIRDDLGNGSNDWGNSVTLQPAGGGLYGVVIAGSIEVTGEGYNMYAARYLSNGKPDNTFFGTSFIHVLSELQDDGSDENPDYGATVKLDTLNRIVVTGSSFSGDDPNFDMAAVRLAGTPVVASARLHARSRSIAENDSGTSNVTIELELSEKASGPVTVEYTTQDGTGTAGVDYVAKSGSVTIAAGSIRQTVNVQMKGNTEYQPNRTFSLKVLGVTGAALATDTATVTIRDNDGTWQNPAIPEDVDADADVEPQDVLRLADDYRANGPRQLTQALETPALWSDVNGDTVVSPADILAILDAVNRKSFFGGQLLAMRESSPAENEVAAQSSNVSLNTEVATGLAAPTGMVGMAKTKLPLDSTSVVVSAGASSVPAVSQAAAVDVAMKSFAGNAQEADDQADELLYELIGN